MNTHNAYTYDNNGNLTADDVRTYTWNWDDTLASVTASSTTYGYVYDHTGQRVSAYDGTATTTYPNRYYSVEGSDVTKYIYAGDELVGQIDGTGATTTTYYVHTDHLGGTGVLTNASSTEAQALDYYPFGAVRVDDDTDGVAVAKQFIGEYADATDLSYLNARYYYPNDGRFTIQDPVAKNNPEQIIGDPQQLNMYSYSRNNPINLLDPSGLLTVVIPGTWHGAGWYLPGTKQSEFVSQVGKTYGETPVVLPWSGENTHEARTNAATFLTTYVSNYKFAEDEKLNIIGHSHGGNVANLASGKLNHRIDNLVTLGTPNRTNYQPTYGNVSQHLNLYSSFDLLWQRLGELGAAIWFFSNSGTLTKTPNDDSVMVEKNPADGTGGGTATLNYNGLKPGDIDTDGNTVILYTGGGFVPSEIRIRAGDALRFINVDNLALLVEGVEYDDFKIYQDFSGPQALGYGDDYIFTFTEEGAWGFRNQVNSAHVGTVVVFSQ